MSVEPDSQQKKKSSMSVLDQLKAVTTIVADTGDFEGKFQTRVTSIDIILRLNIYVDSEEANIRNILL